ncbi:hypothetical protein O6H91_17G051300 [Diphasiastrum complanatum]|uniref:Uncharacterized protein n=1 Tax=Diphasiastrum complanatum TaxID=34168 RepID=A0ACC2B6W2_DIPCM|nr:hypothetical protein O6H91_17G051300 [Diphasiastrum complanatum]
MGVLKVINNNFNLTWLFPLDLQFTYYIRLHVHVCLSKNLQCLHQQSNSHPGAWFAKVTAANTPCYVDFVALMLQGDNTIWLHIGPTPNSRAQFNDAILNGSEILKMNNFDGSLARAPFPSFTDWDGWKITCPDESQAIPCHPITNGLPPPNFYGAYLEKVSYNI